VSYTRNPELSALWLTSPAVARSRCLIALDTSRTIAEAAQRLGVNLSTLRRWIRDHEIPNKHAHEPREVEPKTLGDSPWPETE
jgi:hypothetical protein